MSDDKARAPETGLPRPGESVDVRIARLEEQAKTFGTRESMRDWVEEKVRGWVEDATDKWMRKQGEERVRGMVEDAADKWMRKQGEEKVGELVEDAADKWMRKRALRRWQVLVPLTVSVLVLLAALVRLIISLLP